MSASRVAREKGEADMREAQRYVLFYDSGELALSDASQLKSILNGQIDCLLYGHVTRDYRYQGPRYLTPETYEP